MKDFNNDKFNKSLRKKFEHAEVQPGNHVWEGIEAELLKLENVKMRKKAAFYRNIAAAILLLGLVSLYFNLTDTRFFNDEQRFNVEQLDLTGSTDYNPVRDILASANAPAASENSTLRSSNAVFPNSETGTGIKEKNQGRDVEFRSVASSDAAVIPMLPDNKKEDNSIALNERQRSQSFSLKKLAFIDPAEEQMLLINREPEEVFYFAVSHVKQKESSLAFHSNIDLGSGSFNPNTEITSAPVQSTVSTLNTPGTTGRTVGESFDQSSERAAVQDLSSAPMRANTSFTIGLNFGVQIQDRWAVKTGVQYGLYRASSHSSTVIRDKNSDRLLPYHGATSSSEIADGKVLNVTSEYELYSDFQILSIPVLASYKILDRKFDIAVVGGATADFILRNTIAGGSEQINEITFDQSDAQSYRNVFASGLIGLEFSYPLANKYAVSIIPSYKRAFTNVTTDFATFNSNPSFAGINMSVQYIF